MSQAAREVKNSVVSAFLYGGIALLLMVIIYFISSPMNQYAQQGWGMMTVIVVGIVFLKKLF